ncbi:hypothetical protein TEQG_07653 [Trichophyton equinum CBS 127.97]|uniref:C2H2-type domain-containing protein n=1 Tax=Trichophyton equinum (strain ATCC MYA-4606 / CBS 127.97) TaxID=559882 RepID=F2Q3H6_TRIEC|nr:hypothetical protein TEQG_07653 [Trichophyton equinum CBS 127.97]
MTPMNAIRVRVVSLPGVPVTNTWMLQATGLQHLTARSATRHSVLNMRRTSTWPPSVIGRKTTTLTNATPAQIDMRRRKPSRVHVGNGVKCPFCQTGYATASGLAHHLERAACPNAPYMNRKPFFRKSVNVIRMGALPSSNSNAFNGSSWQCYLCTSCFRSRQGLNQHLNSPVHKQNVYRCPNQRSLCGKEFATLAALFNHLESESCSVVRFETVQRGVNNMILRGKMIAF